jgi:hypothetical protein
MVPTSRLACSYLHRALVIPLIALAAPGCAVPLTLRTDLTAMTANDRHLAGTRVAIRSIRDLRADPDVLGRHRDGFARVPQFKYLARNDPRAVVQRTLEFDLALAGAIVVTPPGPADLVLDIAIGSIFVTTDGALAGEETFGQVSLAVTVYDGIGRPLGQEVVRQHFADAHHADPGLVGDGLTRAIMQIVAALAPPSDALTSAATSITATGS